MGEQEWRKREKEEKEINKRRCKRKRRSEETIWQENKIL